MMAGNIDDPEQVKQAEDREKSAERIEAEDFRRLLETDFGRRYIWRLMEKCGTFGESMNPNHPNAEQTAWMEGRRKIGVDTFKAVCNTLPEAFVEMMKEAKRKKGGK